MAPIQKIGPFIISKKIGEGAFAEVRLAVNEDTGEELAVKIYDRSAYCSRELEKDVKREARIMSSLRHPNIVSLRAALMTDIKIYLFMELVSGAELYDEIVSRRRIDENTSRRYLQQLVDAMMHCHQRGVVHRDLKPENILITAEGNVKVTDFGMSCVKENHSTRLTGDQLLHTQCGTPKYMAPEVIKKSRGGYDGEKIDAWDCGMVLYAMLAGHLPFNGEDDNAVFLSILQSPLQFPPHFSKGAQAVLTKLLEKDPSKRIRLCELFKDDWFCTEYSKNSLTYKQKHSLVADTACLKEIKSQTRNPTKHVRTKTAEPEGKAEAAQIRAQEEKNKLLGVAKQSVHSSGGDLVNKKSFVDGNEKHKKNHTESTGDEEKAKKTASNLGSSQQSDSYTLSQCVSSTPAQGSSISASESIEKSPPETEQRQVGGPKLLQKIPFVTTSLVDGDSNDHEEESPNAPKLHNIFKGRLATPIALKFKLSSRSGEEACAPQDVKQVGKDNVALQSSMLESIDSSCGNQQSPPVDGTSGCPTPERNRIGAGGSPSRSPFKNLARRMIRRRRE